MKLFALLFLLGMSPASFASPPLAAKLFGRYAIEPGCKIFQEQSVNEVRIEPWYDDSDLMINFYAPHSPEPIQFFVVLLRGLGEVSRHSREETYYWVQREWGQSYLEYRQYCSIPPFCPPWKLHRRVQLLSNRKVRLSVDSRSSEGMFQCTLRRI